MSVRRPQSVQVFLTRTVENERQYLIFQRRERIDLGLPAFFQGISGALEGNETYAQAAVREVREETVLTVELPEYVGFSHCYPIRSEWRGHYGAAPSHVEECVFTADISGYPDPKLSAEHTAWQWLSLNDALPLLSYGSNASCLQHVDRFWSTRPVRITLQDPR